MTKSRTEQAYESQEKAITEELKGRGVLVQHYNAQTEELMKPEGLPVIARGEVVPVEDSIATMVIKDTLEDPDTPAVDASGKRLDLLLAAGALEIGIDAANSIEARNSFEKMLAHQMAACHVNGMRLMTEAADVHPMDLNAQALQVKKMNLAARLIDAYQKGFDTLTRSRTAGKQVIVVKQIRVSGGQTIITDNITRGADGGGKPSESEHTP